MTYRQISNQNVYQNSKTQVYIQKMDIKSVVVHNYNSLKDEDDNTPKNCINKR